MIGRLTVCALAALSLMSAAAAEAAGRGGPVRTRPGFFGPRLHHAIDGHRATRGFSAIWLRRHRFEGFARPHVGPGHFSSSATVSVNGTRNPPTLGHMRGTGAGAAGMPGGRSPQGTFTTANGRASRNGAFSSSRGDMVPAEVDDTQSGASVSASTRRPRRTGLYGD